jgi:Tol biopolymer transport system component/imidazolonepropionase-like amidohydrolase
MPTPRRSLLLIALLGISCPPSGGSPGSPELELLSFRVSEGTTLGLDLSPDGRDIVMDLLGQLWLVPGSGGQARAVTDAVRDTAEDLDPSFSPDGRFIVFHGERKGRTGLWLLEAQSGNLRQLTQYPDPDNYEGGPAWSPDGKTIAFAHLLPRDSLHPRARTGIALYHLASGATSELTIAGIPGRHVTDPAWTPDGAGLVVVARAGQAGGRLWLSDTAGGSARPITDEKLIAAAPALAHRGNRIAFLAADSLGRPQVWVQSLDSAAGGPVRITSHDDVALTRVRWTARDDSLLYSADGRIWKAPASGGVPREVRFTAQLSIARPRRDLPPAHFPEPGKAEPVRAFMGLALSPDARRVAMLALDTLWVMEIGGQPRAIAGVPATARHLSWDPSGNRVAFAAGPWDNEDLYSTTLSTGATTRLSALPGREVLPSFSPDGSYLAFIHVPPGKSAGLRVMDAAATDVSDTAKTRNLGDFQMEWTATDAVAAVWSPTGQGVLQISQGFSGSSPPQGTLVRLDRSRLLIDRFPDSPIYLQWVNGGLAYIRHARLWRVPFDSTGTTGAPEALGADPALFLSAATDGTLLYISDGGLRLRPPSGTERSLGWPLRFTPPVPAPLLVQNVRIIPGNGQPLTSPKDILIEGGRISRIAAPGSGRPPQGVRTLDASGRFVMPGLMDLHAHEYRPDLLDGYSYFGVTTIRDQGAPLAPLVAAAEAIAAGIRWGPRVSYGGIQYYSDYAYDAEDYQGVEPEADPDHVRRAIALAGIFGAQHVKTRTFRRWDINARFVAAAHRLGLRVTGHCAHELPLVAAGIDSKEHAGFCTARSDGEIYDDIVQLYRAAGISVVPTIMYSSLAARMVRPDLLDSDSLLLPFISPREDFAWMVELDSAGRKEFSGYARQARRDAVKLVRAGITVGTGTDIWQIPSGVHLELEELVAAGLTPIEAIRAGTAGAAHILGAERDLGTVEVGKVADLVLLDADPTQDIRNTRRIWNVIQGGRLVDRAAIRAAR